MRTQTVSFTEIAVPETGIEINLTNYREREQSKANDNINTKSLSYHKSKNKIIEIVQAVLKRFIDICGGIVGTIILIPLTIIVYIANKICGDGGPVFYTQDRIGKDGQIFKMPKYRSMVVGADDILVEYLNSNEEARLEYEKYKKLKNDPRITKIGSFLRKTSLDEMPQLLLLLTGKMSLVGPRPYLPKEKEDMGEYYDIITKCKPGITGLWQISGRSNATFDDRLDMDIVYYKEKSLKNDIKILFKTVMKVYKKDGSI